MNFRNPFLNASRPPGFIMFVVMGLLLMAMNSFAVDYATPLAADADNPAPMLADTGAPQNPQGLQEVGNMPRPIADIVVTLTAATANNGGDQQLFMKPGDAQTMVWRDFTQAECGLVNNAAVANTPNTQNLRPSNNANMNWQWEEPHADSVALFVSVRAANGDLTRNTPLLC